MWNTPTRKQLETVPNLYETEKTELIDKLVHLHFFIGGSDWYVVEYDRDDVFFGFVVLNCDYANSEWGYFSFSELKSINVNGFEIDRDLYWEVRKASEVDKIREGNLHW